MRGAKNCIAINTGTLHVSLSSRISMFMSLPSTYEPLTEVSHERFERSNVIEMPNRIVFNFSTGL